jgi:hypothetical protein
VSYFDHHQETKGQKYNNRAGRVFSKDRKCGECAKSGIPIYAHLNQENTMLKQNRFTVLSIAVMLALLAAAIMPFAALAQDETPPPVDAPVVDVPPADPPVEDVPVVDVPVVEDLTVPEIFDQLPEGTDLLVLDSSGEILPLTSMAAVDALFGGSAQFCPTGGGACSSPTIINLAIANAYAAGTTGGTITVKEGKFTQNITINGTLFAGGVAPASLTLIGLGSGLTTITGNVSIGDEDDSNLGLKNFTFEGFTLNGTFDANWGKGTLNITDVVQNGSDAASVGFTILGHQGDVNITEINTAGNTEAGLYVSQRFADGNLSITNSVFDGGTTGVDIDGRKGTITSTITENTFNGNTSNGVVISAFVGDQTICNNTFTNKGTWDITLKGAGTANLDTTTNYEKGGFTVTDCSACAPVVPAEPTLLGGGNEYNKPLYIPQIRAVPTLLEESKLPGDLPEGSTLVVIANVALMLEDQQVSEAPNGVQTSFTIPADMKDKTFNVLFWDGAKWITIASSVTGDQISFIVNQPGTYVLVAVP